MNLSQRFDSSVICRCSSYNRNTNAFPNQPEPSASQTKLFPHIKKIYNSRTHSLEQVHILMSKMEPEQTNEESNEQRRRHRTRVSKQRAKILITEFCAKKITDSIKNRTNKTNSTSNLSEITVD